MTQITHNLMNIQERIAVAAARSQRDPDSVQLLAVSKRHPATAVVEALHAGQTQFGENFATEALDKQAQVQALLAEEGNINNDLGWHFIGNIQSNKARLIAQHFSWVHSLDRVKIARRLHQFRGPGRPLNVLVQVNLSESPDRAGVPPEDVPGFVDSLRPFDRLSLRGLMAMAPNTTDYDEQSAAFAIVKQLFDQLSPTLPAFSELSMGMSGDLEAAISNGATWVRIGTDVFGKRPTD